ncbi:UDP-N-acetylhexosamine pyrophosphorylase-like protein 1 [Onthophagus taurus]|uniref:UDP-N-acetylhexosamine pyrophosphorylase-like protein 1 n=1 Tax=Onthophagus taurus TaxID=166361 RepID=UPI000C1FE943|nr:UDP-N-acetylhexosamine pyrophosphorylase-like protein 1 [Onthophagus taurus]
MKVMDELKKSLESAGQEHLLKFYHELDESLRDIFMSQLEQIDFSEVTELFKRAIATAEDDVQKLDARMKPIPDASYGSEIKSTQEELDKYNGIGLEAVSKGEVGVLLMAGGQGTRLGVSYPKGMYSVGLLSNKTLFQIQAERIRRVEILAERQTGKKGVITWYIMTSKSTKEPTVKFLIDNNYFGLNPDNVVIFEQGVIPCFDFNGRIFLENRHNIALAPDGNGGIYKALAKSGALSDMEKRGVRYVHAHSVDNILTKVADPIFMGYCISKNADCGAKVVCKSTPTEAVGVVCLVDEKFQVVEYSEITEKTAHLTDDKGDLLFNAGNICNHFFSTKFLRTVVNEFESQLKLHVAKKKIPHINNNGEIVKPTSPNGIKIEKFVFDIFQFTDNFVTWEVPRHKEFSALKNADDAGVDCPSTARKHLFNLHKTYLQNAGAIVEIDEIEISPLLSYGGEDLNHFNGQTINTPLYLKSKQEEN